MKPVTAPQLKVQRAEQHIEELKDVIDEFVRSSARLNVVHNPDGSTSVGVAAKPLPSSVALVFGDAIHNLRVALDFFYCDVIRRYGEVPGEYAKFPFRGSRAAAIAGMAGATIKVAPERVREAIAEAAYPSDGSESALKFLHDIDINDKHLDLIPIVSAVAIQGVCFEDANHNEFIDGTLALEGPGETRAFRFGPGFKLNKPGSPVFMVYMPSGIPYEGHELFETLEILKQAVVDAMGAIQNVMDN